MILQIPFLLTHELKRKEKSAICLLCFCMFLVLKHLSVLSRDAVFCWLFQSIALLWVFVKAVTEFLGKLILELRDLVQGTLFYRWENGVQRGDVRCLRSCSWTQACGGADLGMGSGQDARIAFGFCPFLTVRMYQAHVPDWSFTRMCNACFY